MCMCAVKYVNGWIDCSILCREDTDSFDTQDFKYNLLFIVLSLNPCLGIHTAMSICITFYNNAIL